MKSLKRTVEVTLLIFVLALLSSVCINNFYIKPMLNLWQNIDENSREFSKVYEEADFNIRVLNNIQSQLNSTNSIEIERYSRILKSYDDNYKKLVDNLNQMYNINDINIKILGETNNYFFYYKTFKKEDFKIELQDFDLNINKIKDQILGLSVIEVTEQKNILNSVYKQYLDLAFTIDSFNNKLQKSNEETANNLINVFNIILVFLFIVISLMVYLIDRIIRKNAKYMMYSLKMLSENNYNISMLPQLKSKFNEEKTIENDIKNIFEDRQFVSQTKDILNGEYILDEIIEKLLYLVKDSMNTNRIGVAYIDYKNNEIIAEYGAFDYGKVLLGPGFSVPIKSTSLKDIITTKKGTITNSIPEELKKRPHSASLLLLDKEGIKSNMIIALISNDQVFGFLFFSSLKENNYSEKDLKLGVKIAQEISGILNTTYLTKKMFISTTNAFANLVEKKDNDTGDHILRMTNYSRIIAEGLIDYPDPAYRVGKRFVSDIANYAPIHDIGKVGIPDNILKKPGKLTPEERAIMETHADIGGEILKEIEENLRIFNRNFFKIAMEIAGGHHEKWDGSGYPKGLEGNEIPLSARIIAIADVFDALSSKRVYKDNFGFENSVEIINEGAGKHFDPELVKVFNNSLNEIRKIYEKNKAK